MFLTNRLLKCSPTKYPISGADSVLMNPSKPILAIKSGQTVEVHNMNDRTKTRFNMPSPVIYWRWINESLLALVTSKSVYHWDISASGNLPEKIFKRVAELDDHTIISYRADAKLEYFALVGLIQAYGGPILGQIQLYSTKTCQSQPIIGHACAFATIRAPQNPDQLINLFCFAFRSSTQNKFIIKEISRIDSSGKSISFTGPKFAQIIDINFPNIAQDDFPISIIIGPKYDIAYMVTKASFLFVFDIVLGKLIYMNRTSNNDTMSDRDTIFVTTPTIADSGFLGINRSGKVMSFGLNEKTVIPYLVSKNMHDVALRLASCANLPGMDGLFIHQFQNYIQEGRYDEAARVAADAPGNLLRQAQTIEIFKNLPNRPGMKPPILQYFGALLECKNLNKIESLELVKIAQANGRNDLIEKWLRDDKLEASEELGEILRGVDLGLALAVFLKNDSKEKVVFIFAELGKFEELMTWCNQKNYTPDWYKVLTFLVKFNPKGTVILAKILTHSKPSALVEPSQVIEIFAQNGFLQELTEYALDVLVQNREEDGPLQTRVLELNMTSNKQAVAEAILERKFFNKFNTRSIAELAEKMKMTNRALILFTDLSDRKRVLRNAGKLDPNFLVSWFSSLGPQQSIECLKELLNANPRENLDGIVKVAQTYWQELGADVLVELFELAKSYEGIYAFLSPILSLIENPDVHFKYIEAAVRMGNLQEVERVVRESKSYNPEKVRDFLKTMKLSNPLPLIIVSDLHGYVDDLIHYLIRNSNKRAIEIYITQINSERTPVVIGTLLDEDCDEDYIKSLLNMVGNLCPANSLVEEVEKRNRLKILLPWLELRAQEGSQEVSIHNALCKVYIENRIDPEAHLMKDAFYDHAIVGKFCESYDPSLAFLAYRTAPNGSCDRELVHLSNEVGLFTEQARYVIERCDQKLWSCVLSDDNAVYRTKLIEKVQNVLPESKSPEEVVVTIKAFMECKSDLSTELIGLVEKIIFESVNPEFSQYPNLQNLLILTSIHSWSKDNDIKVMDYIKKLDKYDVDSISEACIEKGLFEEAFIAYQKFNKHVLAIGVLLQNMHSIDRGIEYSEKINEPEVYSRLGKAQLDQNLVSDAIKSFLKGDDPRYYHEVIAAVSSHSKDSPDLYEDEILYLKNARKHLAETKIDSELFYAFSRAGRLTELEAFLQESHRTNLQDLGDRLFDEKLYEAAKIVFKSDQNYNRLALTLVKTDDLIGAFEYAKRANNTHTWKTISIACIEAGNWKLARSAGLNVITHGGELINLIRYYENRRYFQQICELLEAGLELKHVHTSIFTELGILYANYMPSKLLDHLRQYFDRLNVAKLESICQKNLLWKEFSFLLQQEKQFERCVSTMIEHPSAYDISTLLNIISKVNNLDTIYKAFRFIIEEHCEKITDFLLCVSSRINNNRIIEIAREYKISPLIKPYLLKVQETNSFAVNEFINQLLIEEDDYEYLSTSIENYSAFDVISLAEKLEKHNMIEFRRIAANLYKSKNGFGFAIELLKKEKLYKDAIQTAAESKDQKISEQLLEYFLEQGLYHAFSAALYSNYSHIRPDVVLELAWTYKALDYAYPYLIQLVREYSVKVDQMSEAILNHKEQIQQFQSASSLNFMQPSGSVQNFVSAPPTQHNLNMNTSPHVYQNPTVLHKHQNLGTIPPVYQTNTTQMHHNEINSLQTKIIDPPPQIHHTNIPRVFRNTPSDDFTI